jgi:hypothetical protein
MPEKVAVNSFLMHDALLSQAALYGLKNAREMHPVTSRLPETTDNLASFDS